MKFKLQCDKHPRYKVLRAPKGCLACQFLYRMKQSKVPFEVVSFFDFKKDELFTISKVTDRK